MPTKIKNHDIGDSQLISSSSIMNLVNAPGGAENIVRFYREHDSAPEDDTNHIEYLEIARELWEDHGEPKEITVTIHAGDKLNR